LSFDEEAGEEWLESNQGRWGVIWVVGSGIVTDPGSGAFFTPGSGMGKKSRSGMNISDHNSESVEKIFWVKNT
jgi:hypothetical protein